MFYQLRFQDTEHQLLYLATLFKGTSDRYSGVLEYHICFLTDKGAYQNSPKRWGYSDGAIARSLFATNEHKLNDSQVLDGSLRKIICQS